MSRILRPIFKLENLEQSIQWHNRSCWYWKLWPIISTRRVSSQSVLVMSPVCYNSYVGHKLNQGYQINIFISALSHLLPALLTMNRVYVMKDIAEIRWVCMQCISKWWNDRSSGIKRKEPLHFLQCIKDEDVQTCQMWHQQHGVYVTRLKTYT